MRSLAERKADRAKRRAANPEYAEKPISEELEAKAAEVAGLIDPETMKQINEKAVKQQTVSSPGQIVQTIAENGGDKPYW